jgi:hypothetical protein
VTTALRAYGALATSADTGAVRDVAAIERLEAGTSERGQAGVTA